MLNSIIQSLGWGPSPGRQSLGSDEHSILTFLSFGSGAVSFSPPKRRNADFSFGVVFFLFATS